MSEESALRELLEVMTTLRAPGGCPWDRAQTHVSLKRHLLEETYEVIDAIDAENDEALCEELGDLLLQVIFHAQIAADRGAFTMEDVIRGISKKMIHRHPHVFGEQTGIETPDDVMNIWEVLKSQEGKKDKPKNLLDIPRVLPALLRALKLQEKAARVGFDWPDIEGAWQKVAEELDEVQKAATPQEQKEEVGDAFFAFVNVARFLEVNPEEALDAANEKFRRRFGYIDAKRQEKNLTWQDLDLAMMDLWWVEAKRMEK